MENVLPNHPDATSSQHPSKSTAVPSKDIPQPVVDFLLAAAITGPPSSPELEAQAWKLLDEYLDDSLDGDIVKTTLDSLHVGQHYHDIRIRIMELEPDDEQAARRVRDDLNAMRLDQQPDPVVVPPLNYDSEREQDVDVEEGLSKEHQHLAELLHDTLGSQYDSKGYGVYFVKCQVSPISLIHMHHLMLIFIPARLGVGNRPMHSTRHTTRQSSPWYCGGFSF